MVPPEILEGYAEQIRTAANIRSEALLGAFARVPREDFLGPGPWTVISGSAPGQTRLRLTEVSDPCELYRDVAVFLDSSRNLANGNPSTLATWLDALDLTAGKSVFHLGCATGYYTAIIAEIVGPRGAVTAAEIDPTLAARARENLTRYPNVRVMEGDGGLVDTGSCDAIFINAGVTHPIDGWLDSLTIGGTLFVPVTIDIGNPHVGKGMVLVVSRRSTGYDARFLPMPVMIYSATSIRDPAMGAAFGRQFMAGTAGSIESLRRDPHAAEPSCWLHAASFCLSTQPVL